MCWAKIGRRQCCSPLHCPFGFHCCCQLPRRLFPGCLGLRMKTPETQATPPDMAKLLQHAAGWPAVAAGWTNNQRLGGRGQRAVRHWCRHSTQPQPRTCKYKSPPQQRRKPGLVTQHGGASLYSGIQQGRKPGLVTQHGGASLYSGMHCCRYLSMCKALRLTRTSLTTCAWATALGCGRPGSMPWSPHDLCRSMGLQPAGLPQAHCSC